MATLTIKEMAQAARGLFKDADKVSVLAASVNTKWKGFAVDVVAANHPEVLRDKKLQKVFRREFFSMYITETTKIKADDYSHYLSLNTEGRENFKLTEEIKNAENRAKQYFGRVLKYLKEAIEGKPERNSEADGVAKLREFCTKGKKTVLKIVENSGLGVETNAMLKDLHRLFTLMEIQDFTK